MEVFHDIPHRHDADPMDETGGTWLVSHPGIRKDILDRTKEVADHLKTAFLAVLCGDEFT
jgi:hypothetical protein